ncbi:hypothetical protein FNV43_RR13027 [Rhamnella rubrinervis]|uniref:Uncharacterized protein n=1 Tax=Rhamnella rubrinervis TaxID=2594499 RepID=A0A8K0MEI6_9ROSA|nr:hypothetical protein FNV43_RR13027 [Rhamnella rubrinervis]
MDQLVSTFLCVSRKRSYDLMEEPDYKRPRLSMEPTFFQSDIAAELHQAEVKVETSSVKSCQCPGKGVMVQGELSYLMAPTTPVSSSKFEYKEIGVFEESLRQELEWKKLDVAKFLSGFTMAVPLLDEQVCIRMTLPNKKLLMIILIISVLKFHARQRQALKKETLKKKRILKMKSSEEFLVDI